MLLNNLLANLDLKISNKNLDIKGISSDSRNIKAGYLFAVLDNGISNGCEYIKNAIENGAVAILTDKEINIEGIETILSKNCNLDFAKIVANFYPNHPKNIAAITGTNGKTSIADHRYTRLKLAQVHLDKSELF